LNVIRNFATSKRVSELEQNTIERKHSRDVQMSKLMKQIKAANPSLGQH